MRGLQSRQKERRRGHARSRQGECASWNRKCGPWYTISCTGARPASACHSARLSAWLGRAGYLPPCLPNHCPADAASRSRLFQAPHSQCRRHHARNDASCGGLDFVSREAATRFVTACGCAQTGSGPSRSVPAGCHHRLKGHGPQKVETYGGLEGLPEPSFGLWRMRANVKADNQPRQGCTTQDLFLPSRQALGPMPDSAKE